jgi:hypothetical protein
MSGRDARWSIGASWLVIAGVNCAAWAAIGTIVAQLTG